MQITREFNLSKNKQIIDLELGFYFSFPTKQVLTDITNVVHKLSKGMDCATPAAQKEMLRVIKYLIDNKDYGFEITCAANKII
jgi:hexokinase